MIKINRYALIALSLCTHATWCALAPKRKVVTLEERRQALALQQAQVLAEQKAALEKRKQAAAARTQALAAQQKAVAEKRALEAQERQKKIAAAKQARKQRIVAQVAAQPKAPVAHVNAQIATGYEGQKSSQQLSIENPGTWYQGWFNGQDWGTESHYEYYMTHGDTEK
jgi:hypothetical protein